MDKNEILGNMLLRYEQAKDNADFWLRAINENGNLAVHCQFSAFVAIREALKEMLLMYFNFDATERGATE